MKITIDTREDSPEEIKKVVAMLSHLIENKPISRNIFEESSSELPSTESPSEPSQQTNVFGNIFGDSPSTTDQDKQKEEPEEDTERIITTY